MSTVRIIYHGQPTTDDPKRQHPQAARYQVLSAVLGRTVFVDAIGGEPTTAEVDAVLNPPHVGPTEAERIVDAIKNDAKALAALRTELSK